MEQQICCGQVSIHSTESAGVDSEHAEPNPILLSSHPCSSHPSISPPRKLPPDEQRAERGDETSEQRSTQITKAQRVELNSSGRRHCLCGSRRLHTQHKAKGRCY